MQAGDFVAVQGHSFVDLEIQLVTEGSFNHVALCVSNSEVIEATPHGVLRSPVSQYERYAVYSVFGMTPERAQLAVKFAEMHLGEKYGFLQDAGFAVNGILEGMGLPRISNLWETHGNIVCSSLLDLSLRASGIVLRSDRKAGDLTPVSCTFSPMVRFTENHNLWEV